MFILKSNPALLAPWFQMSSSEEMKLKTPAEIAQANLGKTKKESSVKTQ